MALIPGEGSAPDRPLSRGWLEGIYRRYNRRTVAAGDPVAFLYRYEDPLDREVVAVIAASLAYGRLAGIMSRVAEVLARLGGDPRRFLLEATDRRIVAACAGFRHRFTGPAELAALLRAVRGALRRDGSLEACFGAGRGGRRDDLVDSLSSFVERLSGNRQGIPHLLPSPARGSACKRLWLFLRWMVRHDDVDPGGWQSVSPARLVVPLDVHMHRMCARLGLTSRRQPDLKAALEVTAGFRRVCPEDPVRYDFALTHMSMALTSPSGRHDGPEACVPTGGPEQAAAPPRSPGG